jgi:hypothetical protein
MGKKYYFLLSALFSFSFFTLDAQIYKDNSVKYGGIEEIKTYNLYNKKENPACHLKINFFYPETFSDKVVLNKLQAIFISSFFGKEYANFSPKEAVKSYSKAYLDDYKNTLEKSGIYDREVENARGKGENRESFAAFYNYEKNMRNTILLNQGNIISQVVNVYEYRGGAHGSSSTKGMVLDMDAGKEITYKEIFYENTEEAISGLLYSCLMSARNYPNDDALIDAGFDFTEIRPTDNLVADDNGITFIYNPYELGAYVLGIVEISIPYSDLVVYMKPDCSLFRWARNHIAGNRIKFETMLLTKEYTVPEAENFPGFRTDIQFTYPTAYYDKKTLLNLQKLFVLNAFGRDYASYTPETVLSTFYDTELEKYKKQVEPNMGLLAQSLVEKNEDKADEMRSYFIKDYSQNNNFFFNRNDLISYKIEISQYDGGAHGIVTEKGFIVSVKTGKNLLYADIFKMNTQKDMALLLVTNLLKSKKFNSVKQLTDNSYEIDKIVPNNNFYIDEEGITFIYNPYEIAPYAEGAIRILLPYEEIATYLKPDSPLKK